MGVILPDILPPPLRPANLTAVTAFATNTSYFVYLGRLKWAPTTVNLLCNVTTGAATITWAEVGIFTGPLTFNGAASLTRRGFANVAATFNTTGIKKTAITVAGCIAGEEVWAAFGSQASTPYQVRGVLADDIQTGIFQTFAGRISTMNAGSATTLGGQAAVPPWVALGGLS